MASIVITINTNGVAFQNPYIPDPDKRARGLEIASVLRCMAEQFSWGRVVEQPRDSSNNPCGTVKLID